MLDKCRKADPQHLSGSNFATPIKKNTVGAVGKRRWTTLGRRSNRSSVLLLMGARPYADKRKHTNKTEYGMTAPCAH